MGDKQEVNAGEMTRRRANTIEIDSPAMIRGRAPSISEIETTPQSEEPPLPRSRRSSMTEIELRPREITFEQLEQEANLQEKKNFLQRHSKTFRVAYLACCFMVLNVAWSTIQSFLTVIMTQGFEVQMVLYSSISFAAFFSPVFIQKIGPKWSMVLSAVVYLVYFGCIALGRPGPIFAAAAFAGFFSTVIWTAQGCYMVALTTADDVGRLNGLFYGIYCGNFVFGSSLAGSLLINKQTATAEDVTPLILILTGVAVFGVFMFAFLPSVTLVKNDKVKKPIQTFIQTLKTFRHPKSLFLLTTMAYQGFNAAFMSGMFTPLLPNLKYQPWMYFLYGISRVSGSFIIGRIYDKFSWYPVLALTHVLAFIGYFFCYLGYVQEATWPFFVYAISVGFADIFGVNLINSSIIVLYPEDSADGFSVYRFAMNISSVVGFFLSKSFKNNPAILMVISLILLTGGSITFIVLQLFHLQKNPIIFEKIDRRSSMRMSTQLQMEEMIKRKTGTKTSFIQETDETDQEPIDTQLQMNEEETTDENSKLVLAEGLKEDV
eukprot:TRINITY_DN6339_c0_g1_i1.p1 TRINITY_DN6339_c0_g1~~TRINITY_DN6339_c0_g1_i1.p1  ORF type:complete len:546 (-),score=108.86 TRINITY_DN6339_c0_g1_i1:48-1685(-)